MKRHIVWLAITFVVAGYFHRDAYANNKVTGEMERMSRQFSDARTTINVDQPTLTVLPFQAEKKLLERGIGIAISEMLTAYLIQTKSYKIVERAELNRLLEEQKLGLTGAIETNTAIAVGHLLGCRVVVVGNVVRLGENYQISARMIDVLTAEVLSVAFAEVNAEALDEQAINYVTLVPEKEVIGIYFGYFNPILKGEPIISSNYPYPATGTVNFSNEFGIGVRYFPLKRLYADISYIVTSQSQPVSISTPGYIDGTFELSNTYRASINYTYPSSKDLQTFLGVGVIRSTLALNLDTGGIGYSLPNGDYILGAKKDEKNIILSFITAGIEYHPLERFGISFAMNYLQGKLPNMGIATNKGEQIDLFKVKLIPITSTLMTSLYF